MYQQRQHARPYVPPIEDPPSTPGSVHHRKINEIVENLEKKYRLGLAPRGRDWSPSHSRNNDVDRCTNAIKVLYWGCRDQLIRTINEFEATVQKKPHRDHLPYLRQLLEPVREEHERQSRKGRSGGKTVQQKLEQAATPLPRSTTQLQPAPASASNRPRGLPFTFHYHSSTSPCPL